MAEVIWRLASVRSRWISSDSCLVSAATSMPAFTAVNCDAGVSGDTLKASNAEPRSDIR